MRKHILTILAALSLLLWLGRLNARAYLQQSTSPYPMVALLRLGGLGAVIDHKGLWLWTTLPTGQKRYSPICASEDDVRDWLDTHATDTMHEWVGFLWRTEEDWSFLTRDGSSQGVMTGTCYTLVLPHLFLSAILLILPGVWLLRLPRLLRQRRLAAQGRCPQCGYDLRATPDRCPECGTRAALPTPRR